MTSTLDTPETIAAAHDLAVAALDEVTARGSVGDFVGHEVTEDGILLMRFDTKLLGYPGWHWTVALAAVPGEAPTVLELELLPGEGALVAPEWVPWDQRLEEFKAHQALAAQEAADDDDFDDHDDDDHDDDDHDDDDDDEDDFLHSDDVDGVDIDEMDDDEE